MLFNHRLRNYKNIHIKLCLMVSKSGLKVLTWFTAFKVRVASIIWNTGAYASMISSFTFSICSAVTRIYTFLISTSQSSVTFRISQALIGLALYIGTTLVTWRTLASCSMHIDCTKSFDTTLLIRTWVLTFSLDTCLTQRTLIVTFASS